MNKASTRAKPKRKLLKMLTILTIFLSIASGFTSVAFAADDTDTNANMAEVSEAASAKKIYSKSGDGLDADDPQGNQFTNSGSSYPGLKAVAPNWSFLGLNTKSGLLKKGDADTATVPLKSLIIYKVDNSDQQTGETSNASTKAAQLPAVLQVNGLDTISSTGLFQKIGRWIGGALIMLSLILTSITNIVIILALWLIKSLNPLVIIQSLMHSSGYGLIDLPTSWGDLPLIGNLLDENNVFGKVVDLVLSWSVPTLVILIFGFVMTILFWLPYTRRSGTRGTLFNGLRWVTKRLVMLVILPSIAGSLFLSAFSVMSQGMQSPTTTMKGLMQSTFVQFGDWSDRSRLFLPDPKAFAGFTQTPLKANLPAANTKDASIKWTYKTPDRVPILPNYILAINAFGARDADAVNYLAQNGSAITMGNDTHTRGDTGDATPTAGPDQKLIKNEMDNMASIGNTFKVVKQWMDGSTYSTKSYAGTIENQYNSDKDSKGQTLNQADAIKKDINDPKGQPANTVSGYLQVSSNAIRYTADKGYFSDTSAGSIPAAESVEPLVRGTNAGLSPIGMWNYLNTKVQDGTIVQQDPRKTQDKTSLTHAAVVLPGGFVIGSLSIGIILAFVAATIVPILAVSTMLIKVVSEGVTGWQHILKAFSGSVKAWVHLGQQAIKLLVGIFLLGLVALITPTIANFIISTVDGFTSATNSTIVFGFGKLLEIILLILFTIMLIKSTVVIDDIIGSIATGNQSTSDKAKSIFDRAASNATDDMTSNSSNKLARMMNEANAYDGRRNDNLATDKDGNLLKDKDGKYGLASDVETDPETQRQTLGDPNTVGSELRDRAGKELSNLKSKLSDNTEAENQAKRAGLVDDMQRAASDLERMGLGVPDSLQSDAINQVKNMIGDDNALATPEVLDAAKRLQNATNGLDALDQVENEKSIGEKVGNFASTIGKDAADFAKATAAGKALAGASNLVKNKRKSVEETAAELAQLKDIAEGKPTDDSIYGAMSDAQKSEIDNPVMSLETAIPLSEVNKNMKALTKEAPKQVKDLKSQIQKIDNEIASTANTANNSIADSYGNTQTPSLTSDAEDIVLKAAQTRAFKDGHDANTFDPNAEQSYKNDIASDIAKFDNLKHMTPGQAHEAGKSAYVQQRLDEFSKNPDNFSVPTLSNGMPDPNAREKIMQRQRDFVADANSNYDRSVKALNQGVQAAYDSIPEDEDRVEMLRTASKNHEGFMDKKREEYKASHPDLVNHPDFEANMESAIMGNVMSNQPRNYGMFYSDVQKRIQAGAPRESAIKEAYEAATSRVDDYHLIPRDFGTSSNLILGPKSAKVRSDISRAQTAQEVLSVQRAQLVDKLKALDTSSPTARAMSAGIQDFNKRTVDTLPQLKRYMRTGSNDVQVGDVMDQLANYTNLYRMHENQQPVTGRTFTKLETASRAKVENQLASMRDDLYSKGVAKSVLSNSQKTSQMYNELSQIRNTFGETYTKLAPKSDKI